MGALRQQNWAKERLNAMLRHAQTRIGAPTSSPARPNSNRGSTQVHFFLRERANRRVAGCFDS